MQGFRVWREVRGQEGPCGALPRIPDEAGERSALALNRSFHWRNPGLHHG